MRTGSASVFLAAALALAGALSAQLTPLEVAGQDPTGLPLPRTQTEAWKSGRERMAAQHVPGLVFVMPPPGVPAPAELVAATKEWPRVARRANPVSPVVTAREGVLRLVQTWRQPRVATTEQEALLVQPSDLSVLFALTVPMVLDAETCGAAPGETLLLLDADGKVAGRFRFPLTDERALVAVLAPLLDEKAIAARRAAMPKDLLAEVDSLQSRGEPDETPELHLRRIERRQEAAFRLWRQLHAAAPALVEFRDNVSFDEKGGVHWLRELVATKELRFLLDFAPPLGTAVGMRWTQLPCTHGVRLASHSLLELLPK